MTSRRIRTAGICLTLIHGAAGSFLKAYDEKAEGKTYYKLFNYDAWRGIIGHECVNEIIVDCLWGVLGIEHLSYQLIHAKILIDQNGGWQGWR